jgi:asparaginyl-tRNA synthetase
MLSSTRIGIRRCSTFTDCSVSSALDKANIGRNLRVRGWAKAVRKQKTATFVDVDDGSGKTLQVVAPPSEHAAGLRFHSAVEVIGTLIESGHPKQEVELAAERVDIVALCGETMGSSRLYPFGPRNKYQDDHARQYPMFRAKLNDFAALLRVRNALSSATHTFFQERGFIQIQTPILTGNDCEGAGEVFVVRPAAAESKDEDNYFGHKTYLTVSGQLHLEAACNGLGKVYNFSPVFRAERGRTRRHLAEFTMVEAEEAFVTETEQLTSTLESLVKQVVGSAFESRSEDFEIYSRVSGEDNSENVKRLLNCDKFIVMGYDEAFSAVDRCAKDFQGHNHI